MPEKLQRREFGVRVQGAAGFLRDELPEAVAAQIGIDRRLGDEEADDEQDEEHRDRPQREANPSAGAGGVAGTGGNGHAPLLPLTKRASIHNAAAAMLELQDVSLQLGNAPDDQLLLSEVSARFPKKHFAAILGPSGCGKSTLLKVIAGLREPTLGHIEWEGRDLSEEGDMDPHEIGYVPQFSIAYDLLTVWESVESALRLRVSGLSGEEQEERLEKILREVGLDEISDREVRVLSGGQKRRLAMALEMVSSPHLLLCDEVTSGLDPKAEDEIAKLMHQLSQRDDRIVLSVTHSLRHLALYDSVVVLYPGPPRLSRPGAICSSTISTSRSRRNFSRASPSASPTTGIARGKSIARPTTPRASSTRTTWREEVALEEVSSKPAKEDAETEARFKQAAEKGAGRRRGRRAGRRREEAGSRRRTSAEEQAAPKKKQPFRVSRARPRRSRNSACCSRGAGRFFSATAASSGCSSRCSLGSRFSSSSSPSMACRRSRISTACCRATFSSR